MVKIFLEEMNTWICGLHKLYLHQGKIPPSDKEGGRVTERERRFRGTSEVIAGFENGKGKRPRHVDRIKNSGKAWKHILSHTPQEEHSLRTPRVNSVK